MSKMKIPLREPQAPSPTTAGPWRGDTDCDVPESPPGAKGGPEAEGWPLGFGGVDYSMDVRVSGKLTRDGLLDHIFRDPHPPESNGHDATALFIQFLKGLRHRDARPLDHCYRGPRSDAAERDHVAVNATFLIYQRPPGDAERGGPWERHWVTEYVTDGRMDEGASNGRGAHRPSGPTGTAPLCPPCQQAARMNDLRGQVLGVFGVHAPGPGPCCRDAKPAPLEKTAGVRKRTKRPQISGAAKRNAKPPSRPSSRSGLGAEADKTKRDYVGSGAKNEPLVWADIMNLPPAGDDPSLLGIEPTGVGSPAWADEPWEGPVPDGGGGIRSVGNPGLVDDDWLRV